VIDAISQSDRQRLLARVWIGVRVSKRSRPSLLRFSLTPPYPNRSPTSAMGGDAVQCWPGDDRAERICHRRGRWPVSGVFHARRRPLPTIRCAWRAISRVGLDTARSSRVSS